jgi:hypothetical protein
VARVTGSPTPITHHVEDRLLPLKQTVRHPLDPPSTLLVRRPSEEAMEASHAAVVGNHLWSTQVKEALHSILYA